MTTTKPSVRLIAEFIAACQDRPDRFDVARFIEQASAYREFIEQTEGVIEVNITFANMAAKAGRHGILFQELPEGRQTMPPLMMGDKHAPIIVATNQDAIGWQQD